MSTAKQRRAAKKRQKHKKKRDAARRTRGSRAPLSADGSDAVEALRDASRWPLGDCYLSQNWHERGAEVHAAFVRQHADGRAAASFFEVDLAERGVMTARSAAGVPMATIQGELVSMSTEEQSMMQVDPGLVVKLVVEGARHGRLRKHAQAQGYERARVLFGDVRPDEAEEEILCGTEEAPAEAERQSWVQRLRDRVGL